jgi:cytochrome c-type biogenesis protein CcmH
VAFLVSRYGDFVLMQPPMKPATYVLWFAPPLLLVGGAGALVLALRRRRAGPPAPPPLNADEQARLAGLLQETDR